MKLHIGGDVNNGAIHAIKVTPANEADISLLPELLHEDDQASFGHARYNSGRYKRGARQLGMH